MRQAETTPPASTDLALSRRIVEEAQIRPDSESFRSATLAFIDDHHDALHRSCVPGHLTGSALVVDAAGERFVLMHHRKIERWLQPGGHADGEANLALVAWLEATEETGLTGLRVIEPAIDVDIHASPLRVAASTQLDRELSEMGFSPKWEFPA